MGGIRWKEDSRSREGDRGRKDVELDCLALRRLWLVTDFSGGGLLGAGLRHLFQVRIAEA